MATVTQASQLLMTAEEFSRRPDPGYPEELVRGRIEKVSEPHGARHGQVCSEVTRVLGNHVRQNGLGYVLCNGSGVITERGPDTVRGADVAFYSYAKLLKGPLPWTYLDVPPDLIIEVLSPDDRWSRVLVEVAEYLNIGVLAVGVLDPERATLHLFEPDRPVQILSGDDELKLPAILGDFRVTIRSFLD